MAQVVYGYRATVEAGEGGHEKDCEEAVNYPAAQGRENTGATPTSLRGTSGGGAAINQTATQSKDGGITAMYKRFGTYCKAFTTVMMMPNSIDWGRAVPCIVPERYMKGRP